MSARPWKRGSAAARAANAVVPLGGEIGIENNTGRIVGSDGTTAWKDLSPLARLSDLTGHRVSTLTVSSNTYTPNGDTTDVALIISPVANFTVVNPSGTPVDEQKLMIKVKSGSTGFTPTWGSIYISSGVATLPSGALPASKTVSFGFIYDALATKWVLLAADAVGY